MWEDRHVRTLLHCALLHSLLSGVSQEDGHARNLSLSLHYTLTSAFWWEDVRNCQPLFPNSYSADFEAMWFFLGHMPEATCPRTNFVQLRHFPYTEHRLRNRRYPDRHIKERQQTCFTFTRAVSSFSSPTITTKPTTSPYRPRRSSCFKLHNSTTQTQRILEQSSTDVGHTQIQTCPCPKLERLTKRYSPRGTCFHTRSSKHSVEVGPRTSPSNEVHLEMAPI